MPHLVQMQESYEDRGLALVGVSDADAEAIRAYVDEHELNYRVLANAAAERERFGVDMIWGTAYFLVDPTGTVVAGNLQTAQSHLTEALGPL